MYEAYCTYVDDKYFDNHDYDDDTDADTDNDTGDDTDDDINTHNILSHPRNSERRYGVFSGVAEIKFMSGFMSGKKTIGSLMIFFMSGSFSKKMELGSKTS